MKNPYLPSLAQVISVRQEAPQIKFLELEQPSGFRYAPGQSAMLSVLGRGESVFSIASNPFAGGHLEFAIKEVGSHTRWLHNLRAGDEIGIRGPIGTPYPLGDWQGERILIIGGGIGIAPLRGLIWAIHEQRSQYAKADLIYGARSPEGLCFRSDLSFWQDAGSVNIYLSVDEPNKEWSGAVGTVLSLLETLDLDPGLAVVCGPPVMIRSLLPLLVQKGYPEGKIFATLELKMKCGVGSCGRCNIGEKYLCTDGPTFNLTSLRGMGYEF